jgi:hypothetical protein
MRRPDTLADCHGVDSSPSAPLSLRCSDIHAKSFFSLTFGALDASRQVFSRCCRESRIEFQWRGSKQLATCRNCSPRRSIDLVASMARDPIFSKHASVSRRPLSLKTQSASTFGSCEILKIVRTTIMPTPQFSNISPLQPAWLSGRACH